MKDTGLAKEMLMQALCGTIFNNNQNQAASNRQPSDLHSNTYRNLPDGQVFSLSYF